MENEKIFYTGLGKRKTSVAKIQLSNGSGIITVNKKPFEEFFTGIGEEKEIIKAPFVLINLVNVYNLDIHVKGGGISSQLEAIRLAIVKALAPLSLEYRQIFKQKLWLRRDSRIKERRKYGLKKARKASQYSKR